MILRPGIQMLLQDAQAGQFDMVLAEALDRISRDQADVATLFKHLKFAGVPIVTLAEGEISELHVGLKGTMNALFLKDLAAKTHRGIRGRVEEGKSGVLTPGLERGEIYAKLHGELRTILEWTERQAVGKSAKTTKPAVGAAGLSVSMVAGACNYRCHNSRSSLIRLDSRDAEDTQQLAA